MNMSKRLLIIITLLLVFVPFLSVAAKDKKISVSCYCDYDKNGVKCSEDCSKDSVEKSIKKECGGLNSVIKSEVKYYCNRSDLLWIPVKDNERDGASALESCTKYYNYASKHFTEEIGILKVTIKADCEPISDAVGEFFCKEEDVLKAFRFVGYILFFAKLLVPFIIIIMATFDYYKAVTAEKDDALQKQTKVFIRRLLTGIVIFFLPTILNTFMNLVNGWSDVKPDYEECVSCALDPIDCNK